MTDGFKNQPRILITTGDPNGIGPEIAVKALLKSKKALSGSIALIGCPELIEKALQAQKSDIHVHRISIDNNQDIFSINSEPCCIRVVPPDCEPFINPSPGKISKRAGRIAHQSIVKAHELIMSGAADLMVTCPVNKEAIRNAGFEQIAHTEILSKLCAIPRPVTLFIIDRLWIAFFTRHLSLRAAVEAVNKKDLIRFVDELIGSLKGIGIKNPKLAVAALNPHSGEGGLLGQEEAEEISPAVEELKKNGTDIHGPVPADSVFHLGLQGEYSCVISLYHDQGHIAAKTLNFHKTVSLTLGLPYIRTSVDHGTGFNIAWQGKASPESLLEAVDLAVNLFQKQAIQ